MKISAGSSKREVKEEVKIKTEKHVSNSSGAVVLNGNGKIVENVKEAQKPEKVVEVKKPVPAEVTKVLNEESSESEPEVKVKESDSDVDVAMLEDDIDLEDLMRQKVIHIQIIYYIFINSLLLHFLMIKNNFPRGLWVNNFPPSPPSPMFLLVVMGVC